MSHLRDSCHRPAGSRLAAIKHQFGEPRAETYGSQKACFMKVCGEASCGHMWAMGWDHVVPTPHSASPRPLHYMCNQYNVIFLRLMPEPKHLYSNHFTEFDVGCGASWNRVPDFAIANSSRVHFSLGGLPPPQTHRVAVGGPRPPPPHPSEKSAFGLHGPRTHIGWGPGPYGP